MFNESHIYIDHIKIKMIPELTIKETFFLINYLYLCAKYQCLCVVCCVLCGPHDVPRWWGLRPGDNRHHQHRFPSTKNSLYCGSDVWGLTLVNYFYLCFLSDQPFSQQPLTPSAGPQYQSHVYDNCDECEELLCFSLQLTWHKIFHYKLIATILWFSHSIVTDAQNVFNTGPNYFAINSQFLKLSLISNLIRTLSFSFFLHLFWKVSTIKTYYLQCNGATFVRSK